MGSMVLRNVLTTTWSQQGNNSALALTKNHSIQMHLFCLHLALSMVDAVSEISFGLMGTFHG